jgi:hypothetical protein
MGMVNVSLSTGASLSPDILLLEMLHEAVESTLQSRDDLIGLRQREDQWGRQCRHRLAMAAAYNEPLLPTQSTQKGTDRVRVIKWLMVLLIGIELDRTHHAEATDIAYERMTAESHAELFE